MTFAERVKNLRKWRNMTQEELAKRSNVGLGQISKIERGDNKEPKLSTITKIMNGLEVSADKLIPSPNEQGLKGIIKSYLETLDKLPSQDIKAVIRIIENLSFEQKIRSTMDGLKPDMIETHEAEIFSQEIEARTIEEHREDELELMDQHN